VQAVLQRANALWHGCT